MLETALSSPGKPPGRGGVEPLTCEFLTFAQRSPGFQESSQLSFSQVRALSPPLIMALGPSGVPVCPSSPRVFANREAHGLVIATEQHGESGTGGQTPRGERKGTRDGLRTQQCDDSPGAPRGHAAYPLQVVGPIRVRGRNRTDALMDTAMHPTE